MRKKTITTSAMKTGKMQYAAPYLYNCHLWAFSCSILHLLVICWSRRLTDTTTNIWKDMIENKPPSWSNKFWNVPVSGNYCMTGPKHMWDIQGPLDKGRTNLHTFLPEYHDTRPYLAHLTLLSFHRQWQRNQQEWHDIRDNNGWFWNSQCHIIKTTTILNIWQLMRWMYFSKGRMHSSRISRRNINISELKFTNCVTFMATHGTGHKRLDSDQCYIETTDKKCKGAWPYVIYRQILFFSWVNDLTEQKIYCCGSVTPNRKEKPDNFWSRTQTEKWEC